MSRGTSFNSKSCPCGAKPGEGHVDRGPGFTHCEMISLGESPICPKCDGKGWYYKMTGGGPGESLDKNKVECVCQIASQEGPRCPKCGFKSDSVSHFKRCMTELKIAPPIVEPVAEKCLRCGVESSGVLSGMHTGECKNPYPNEGHPTEGNVPWPPYRVRIEELEAELDEVRTLKDLRIRDLVETLQEMDAVAYAVIDNFPSVTDSRREWLALRKADYARLHAVLVEHRKS